MSNMRRRYRIDISVTSIHKKLLAEAIGTFALVFAGTTAIVVNESTGAVTNVGIALTFGLIVFAMISALGDISGAHLNPAVTLGFWFARKIGGRSALLYVASQCVGAVLASVTVWALFPIHGNLGATLPAGSSFQSFVVEFILTAGLMFVILNVSTGAKESGLLAGLAVGGVIALEALFAGPVSGASMNPARSLAPALVGWNFAALWLYLLAPPLGALLAVIGCRCVREKGCCSAAC